MLATAVITPSFSSSESRHCPESRPRYQQFYKHGFGDAPFCNKRGGGFGGMAIADVWRLRKFEGRIGKFKNLPVEARPGIDLPKAVARGNYSMFVGSNAQPST